MVNIRPLACIIAGILTFIAGIILLITSSVLLDRIAYLYKYWELIFALSITSIITGSLAIIFALGLVYVVQRRYPASITLFSSLLLVVAAIAATSAIILLADRPYIRTRSFDNTRRIMVNYTNWGQGGTSKSLTDQLQQTYACCGVNKATDWKSQTFNRTSTPDSCCLQVTVGCGTNSLTVQDKIYLRGSGTNSLILQDKIYLRGCAELISEQFREIYTILIGMNFSLMILALITAILGFIFELTFRQHYQLM